MEMSNDVGARLKGSCRVYMYVYRTLLETQRKERKHAHTCIYNYISFPFSMVYKPKTASLILPPGQKSLHRKAAAANCRHLIEKPKKRIYIATNHRYKAQRKEKNKAPAVKNELFIWHNREERGHAGKSVTRIIHLHLFVCVFLFFSLCRRKRLVNRKNK